MSEPKKATPSRVNIDLAAKAEAKLDVKAKVPTRSVGRLVDAFTDMIRPFSEGRGLKADLIRLQREEVAIEIAKRARARVAIEKGKMNPVSPKILIPLIEKGSCEDIDDHTMIDLWANLLASASLEKNVHPRFIGIIGEMTKTQAECLSDLATNWSDKVEYPYTCFADAYTDTSEWVTRLYVIDVTKRCAGKKSPIRQIGNEIVDSLRRPGCLIETILIKSGSRFSFEYDFYAERKEFPDDDLEILGSLGLVRQVNLDVAVPGIKGRPIEVGVHYWHLTKIGTDFFEVCAPGTIRRFEEKQDRALG